MKAAVVHEYGGLRFPLSEAARAHAAVESHATKGRVLIMMDGSV